MQRLEVGLTLTGRGVVAFPAEDMRPSLTLTLGARQRSVSPRSGTKKAGAVEQDIVRVEEGSQASEVVDRPSGGE